MKRRRHVGMTWHITIVLVTTPTYLVQLYEVSIARGGGREGVE